MATDYEFAKDRQAKRQHVMASRCPTRWTEMPAFMFDAKRDGASTPPSRRAQHRHRAWPPTQCPPWAKTRAVR